MYKVTVVVLNSIAVEDFGRGSSDRTLGILGIANSYPIVFKIGKAGQLYLKNKGVCISALQRVIVAV